MLKSIMGKVVDCKHNPYFERARVLPPSGWNPKRARSRFTGEHKQMGRAEMTALVTKLQRQAAR